MAVSQMNPITKMPVFWRWAIGGIFAIGVGVVGFSVLAPKPDPSAKFDKFTTTVELVKSTDIRITSAGQVAPNRKVNVGPKEAGLLAQLFVDQGQSVKQGQILARMDTSRVVSEVAQAKATAELSRARYLESRNGFRTQEITQSDADLLSAKASFQISRNNFERYQTLSQAKAISDIELNTRRLEFEKAQESLKSAEAKLNLLKSGNRFEQVMAAKAQMEQSNAQLANATTRLNDLTIRAPFTGIVSQRYAQPGSFVSPTVNTSGDSANSSSILLLIDRLEVLATVAESDIARIKVGQPVQITTTAYPGKVFKGNVRLVAPEAVQESGITQFQVRVRLNDEAAYTLKSRLNVSVNFIAGQLKDALLIPTTAIISKDNKTGVLIPDPKKGPTYREVTTGQSLGEKTQVLSGLKSGEKIFGKLPPDLNIEEILGKSNDFR